MRRLLLVAAIWGAATAAHAADMPDLPALRGGFTDGVAARTVNWEGFYVGGQGGYGSSDARLATANQGLISDILTNTAVNDSLHVSSWNLPQADVSSRSAAFGVFGGYNAQWDDVVLGLEVSYVHGKFGASSVAHMDRNSSAPYPTTPPLYFNADVTSTAAISITDMATFRGRAAYAWGCFLPYVFGGFALGNANITRSVVVTSTTSPNIQGPYDQPDGTFIGSADLHNHLVYGYSLGLGVDMNLTGNLFMRAEWEYARFVNQVDTTINTARLGLGYKF